LANSFPGQAWIPLPNGIKVLGFGAAWQIIKQNLSSSGLCKQKTTVGKHSFTTTITSNLEGSNFSGSLKLSGLWCMFLNRGSTFHPFGIRYPKENN